MSERGAAVNERIALILGSALAALVVVVPMVWLLGATDSEPAAAGFSWTVHLRLTLPAMAAVVLSALWHSREGRAVDCDDLTLATRIAWWSFPIFATILVVVFALDEMIFADRIAGLATDLVTMAMALFVMIMLASIVLFIPAFIVEYTIVRMVRSDRMRALLSGVEF